MADAKIITDGEARPAGPQDVRFEDTDPVETREWLESLDYVLETRGADRVSYLGGH